MHPVIHSLCALTLSLGITAQTEAQPPAPVARLEIAGPAGWRQRLGPTNLGSLLSSAEGSQLLRPLLAPLEQAWQQYAGGTAADFAASRGRLLDYAGRVETLLWLDPPASAAELPAMVIGLVCHGDGRTDLDALSRDLQQLVGNAAGSKWRDLEVSDRKVPGLTVGGFTLLAPARDGERLVAVAFQAPLTAGPALQRVLALPATATSRAPTGPALSLHVDVATAYQMATRDTDREMKLALAALGAPSVGACDFRVEAAGPHVMMELALEFQSEDRGLFAACFPPRQDLPRLLTLVPPGCREWKAGHFDLQAAYESAERAMTAFVDGDTKQARASVVAELGIDPIADLLAHATDEMLVFGTSQPFSAVADVSVSGGVVLRLRDEAAFRSGFSRIRKQARGWLELLETKQHDGVEIQRLGGLILGNIHLAIAHGICVVGFGPEAEARVTAAIDAAKAHPPGDAAATLPEALASAVRFAPPGLNGAAETDAMLMLLQIAGALGLVAEVLPDLPDLELRRDDEAKQQLLPLLQQHHLERLHTLTGFAEQRWCFRALW